MSSTAIRRFGVRCILGLLSCAAPALAQNSRAFYISFQVPNSAGISSASISDCFTVAGTFTDTNRKTHGFIRAMSGRVTTFDVPGSVSTATTGINDEELIIGTWTDSSNQIHGFLRHPQGSYTQVNVPGSTETVPTSINALGAITGYYFTSGAGGSFIRSPQGKYTTFTQDHAESINLFEAVTGFTRGTLPIEDVGFVRSSKGTVTLFSAPGSTSSGTFPNGIDANGDIAGNYFGTGDIQQGFLRSHEGTFTQILPPNAFQTQVVAINQLGVIAGFYSSGNLGMGGQHSFIRDLRGNITTFDPPNATGSTVYGMNDFDVIVGATANSGFLRVPY
jgi:hypothetical protein